MGRPAEVRRRLAAASCHARCGACQTVPRQQGFGRPVRAVARSSWPRLACVWQEKSGSRSRYTRRRRRRAASSRSSSAAQLRRGRSGTATALDLVMRKVGAGV